jgi:cell division protein FtsW
MARKLRFDKLLFLATLLLVCAGVVMVYSASAVMALERYQQPDFFLIKQAMWAVLGVALLMIVMRVDYRSYRTPAFLWGSMAVVSTALVLVLFMPAINGSSRWFGIGGIGVQPSELAKLCTIFFIAALLERRMHRIDEVSYSLLPITLVVGALVALILAEPDYGTALSLVVIAAVMVLAAGLSYNYLVGALLAGLPVMYFVLIASEYRRRRLLAFWNPWDDPLDSGFQIIQSLIAVGTGGVAGRGLMGGVQKLFYLPEPHTDFVFAVIGEELGLIGTTAVLACFCVITWRGLRIALTAPDSFAAFLAVGVTAMIALQAFVNISVVLGLLPTKGMPLPFVSAGGSSLLINFIGVGVLLNVSQHANSDA